MLKHSRNLTWPIFSLYPSPQEFDEARPLVNYKSTNAQISAFSTEREREFQLYCWSRCDWTFLPFLSSTWRLEHTGEAWATLLSDDDAVANEAARPTEGINKIWRLKKAEQRPKERDEKGIWYFTVHLRKIEMTLFLQFHVLSMSDVLPVWAETRLRAALKTNIRSHIWLYIYIYSMYIYTHINNHKANVIIEGTLLN